MRLKRILSVILIALGVVWSIGFPKTSELDRPDFVMSVAISVGLLGSGILLFALKTKSWLIAILTIALLWSGLANVSLYALARDATRIMSDATRHRPR
jgi:hypothetical protein